MNITEVLDELQIEYRLPGQSPHVTGNWLGIKCPFCGQGTDKYGLGIHRTFLAVSCWKCGKHSLASVLLEASGQSYRIIRPLIDALGGEPLPEADRPKSGRLELPIGVKPMGKAHRNYLKGRGFDPDELEAVWQFQGIGIAPQLAWRIFIPIFLNGKMVSWSTRSIVDDHPLRYISAKPQQEAISAKSILYGIDYVKHAAIIVEGPLDAVRIGKGAIATLGTGHTQAQLLMMAKIPIRTICFDKETEAQKRADELAKALACFPGITKRVELDADDPGSASPKEIALLRKSFL